MTCLWIEPDEDGVTPVERKCSDAEAIRAQRAAFRTSRPGQEDPRTDAQCLDDFIVVHWAIHQK